MAKEHKFKKMLGFTSSQFRAILLLLPIILIISGLISLIERTNSEESFLILSDTLLAETPKIPVLEIKTEAPKEIKLFDFDPNTIDYRGLRDLGFSSHDAASIIKFREKYNKVFELPTDFATLHAVNDSIFYALEPYIKIKRKLTTPAPVPKPEQKIKEKEKVDINLATKEELISLNGIGELSANRIIEYREKLGGYSEISQLLEVEGVFEKNYLKFCEEIFVKNDGISKIDINFAGAEIMSKHPYMDGLIIRKVLKHRQLKGGLGSITEMIEAHIITEQQAKKLADYLIFNTETPQ